MKIMMRKVDRLLDLLILVGYSISFPAALAKRLSGHEQYDRNVMYRAIRKGYVVLIRRESKRQVIRSLQLTEKGEDYIAERDPSALAMIYGRKDMVPQIFPSREAKILRLHAIATGLVMARAAGALIPPMDKPSLLFPSRDFQRRPVDNEQLYYYSPFELRAAFEELDDRAQSKTSRLIGIIVRDNRCFFMYYAGKQRIYWQRISEENNAIGIKGLLQARGFQKTMMSQIVIGNRMNVAEKLCRSPRINGDRYFVVSDFFDNCYFVTNDAAGDALLPMILRTSDYLDFNRHALAAYQPSEYYKRVIDAVEPLTGRPVLLGYDCDLRVLDSLRQQRYGFQKKPIMLCLDYQRQAMENILQDTAEVRTIGGERER